MVAPDEVVPVCPTDNTGDRIVAEEVLTPKGASGLDADGTESGPWA